MSLFLHTIKSLTKIAVMVVFVYGFLCAEMIDGGVLESLDFENNRNISSRALRRITGIQKGSFVAQEDLAKSVGVIKKKYQEEGYFFVDVNVKEESDESGHLKVKFVVEEGDRVKIKETRFSGNESISEKRLLKIIESKKGGVFKSTYLNEEQLQKDCKVLESYYERRGYNASVPQVIKTFSSEGDEVVLTFMIFEGSTSDKMTPQKNDSSYEDVETYSVNAFEDASEEVVKLPELDEDQVSPLGVDLTNSSDDEKNDALDNKALLRMLEEKNEVEGLLSGLLAAEKIKNKDAVDDLTLMKMEVSRLRNELSEQREEKKKIMILLEESQKREKKYIQDRKVHEGKNQRINHIVMEKLAEIDKVRESLGDIVKEVRREISKELDKIELAPITIQPQSSQEGNGRDVSKLLEADKRESENQSKLLEGQVLVVNPDLNFVVINVGASKGAFLGATFKVMKGTVEIAKIKIIEVRKNISAADVLSRVQEVKVGHKILEIEK